MKKSELIHLVREVVQVTEKKKGVDGKACWKGYRYAGTKNGKDVCIKVKGVKEETEADSKITLTGINEGPGKDYLDKTAKTYFKAKDFESSDPKPNPNDVALYIGETETDEIGEQEFTDWLEEGNYDTVKVAEYQFEESRYNFKDMRGAGEYDSATVIFKVIDKMNQQVLIPGDKGKKYPFLAATDRGALGDTYPLLKAEHVKILKSIADIFQPEDVYENYVDSKVKGKSNPSKVKKSELTKLIREELQGYSPQIGKTKGLTPATLNKILKKIASGDDYEPEGEVKEGEESSIEKELEAAMKIAGQKLATAAKSAKVSKEDNPENVQEGVVLTLGLIAGAPGLIEFLGKAVNYVGRVFGAKAGTKVGNFLTKIGHKFENYYISSIGGWLTKAFPEKFKGQDPNDVSSSLHDYAHGIYLAMICALGIGAGVQSAKALQLAVAGVEGGLAGLKSYEVVKLAKEIAKFGVKV